MVDPRTLIDGYFDEILDADQHATLCDWVKSDPEHARLFATAALLHDRLRNHLAMGANIGDLEGSPVTTVPQRWSGTPWPTTSVWRATAGAVLLVAGLAVLWLSLGIPTAAATIREMDRIISSSIRSKDRTYEIVVEEISTPERRGKRAMREEAQRPPKPPLDGATLHVRLNNQFVLIRKTEEGLPFITGCNGKQSWSINTRGPVKVSSDIHHFDHDLPGHETSVPLSDLHAGLEQLKRAYNLQFSTLGPEEYTTEHDDDVRLLVAVKKPKERGPQRVEIVYDSNTGRILKMRFVQMPYGPNRLDLRLSLVDESDLPAEFFDHASHHAPDHKIEVEN
jgi:hypothetical protein